MEFQKFANERKRMCEHYSNSIAGCYDEEGNICPLFAAQDYTCIVFCLHQPKEAEEIVSKWASEHPVMTNRQKFKEVFGIDIDGGSSKCLGIKCPYRDGERVTCNSCPYRNFWDQKYKEEE